MRGRIWLIASVIPQSYMWHIYVAVSGQDVVYCSYFLNVAEIAVVLDVIICFTCSRES